MTDEKPKTKPGPTMDPYYLAQVLCDAAFSGDEGAAKLHGITSRTVQAYRAKLRDGKLPAGTRELFEAKRDYVGRKLDERLYEAECFLIRRALELAAKEPDLYKVTGTLKTVSDARGADSVRKRILGAEDGGQRQPRDAADPAGAKPGPSPAGTVGERSPAPADKH